MPLDCPACDSIMDVKGHHAKMCACLGDRVLRHNAAERSDSRRRAPPFARSSLQRGEAGNMMTDLECDLGKRVI